MRRAAALAACALVAACARKKEPAAAPAAAATAPAAKPAHAPYMSGTRQPRVLHKLAVIRLDEGKPLVLAPAGAQVAVIEPVAHAAIGERVEGRWCVAGAATVAEMGAAIVVQYGAAGWSAAAVHPNPNLRDRATISAEKPPYALFGNLVRGAAACPAGVLVTLGVHRVEAVVPREVGPSGTRGLRVQ